MQKKIKIVFAAKFASLAVHHIKKCETKQRGGHFPVWIEQQNKKNIFKTVVILASRANACTVCEH